MRYFINTIKTIALICGLLLLAFVIINWGDEKLKPEVAQALAWKPPHDAFEDNGYLILLGIEAPAEMSAKQVGTKFLKAELARYASMQKTHKESLAIEQNPAEIHQYIDWKDNHCDYIAQANCVDFYLKQGAAKLTVLLASQDRLAARFDAIMQSKSYVEVMPPMISAQIPSYSPLMNASELARIQAVVEISEGHLKQGVAKFAENAAFSRRLLRESNSLVSHMLAISMMQKDTRVLSELMIKYPAIASEYSAQLMPILVPITSPEYMLSKAFIVERNRVFPVISNMKNTTASELAGEKTPYLQKVWIKFGFQPNSTMNLICKQANNMIDLAELDAAQFAIKKAHYLAIQKENSEVVDYRLLTQKNPIGRILASISAPEYDKYIERQHDLDGYLYMVNFQLIAQLNKLEIKKLTLHDPYNNLMQYDASRGVLTFKGRQPSTGNYNKSSQYQVKLQ